jgi:transcriptional regulator GlxA family with amidase domain
MHMSVRHFARVFRQATGSTPAAYREAARVEAARRVLEETDQSLAAVANTCGFGSVETLYRSFRRRLNTTPADYRKRFRTPGMAAVAAAAPIAPVTPIAAVG